MCGQQWAGHRLLSSSARDSGEAPERSSLVLRDNYAVAGHTSPAWVAGCSHGASDLTVGWSVCKAHSPAAAVTLSGGCLVASGIQSKRKGAEERRENIKEAKQGHRVRLTNGPFFTVAIVQGRIEGLLVKKRKSWGILCGDDPPTAGTVTLAVTVQKREGGEASL